MNMLVCGTRETPLSLNVHSIFGFDPKRFKLGLIG